MLCQFCAPSQPQCLFSVCNEALRSRQLPLEVATSYAATTVVPPQAHRGTTKPRTLHRSKAYVCVRQELGMHTVCRTGFDGYLRCPACRTCPHLLKACTRRATCSSARLRWWRLQDQRSHTDMCSCVTIAVTASNYSWQYASEVRGWARHRHARQTQRIPIQLFQGAIIGVRGSVHYRGWVVPPPPTWPPPRPHALQIIRQVTPPPVLKEGFLSSLACAASCSEGEGMQAEAPQPRVVLACALHRSSIAVCNDEIMSHGWERQNRIPIATATNTTLPAPCAGPGHLYYALV